MTICLECGKKNEDQVMIFGVCTACKGVVCSETCMKKHLATDKHKTAAALSTAHAHCAVLTPEWEVNLYSKEGK